MAQVPGESLTVGPETVVTTSEAPPGESLEGKDRPGGITGIAAETLKQYEKGFDDVTGLLAFPFEFTLPSLLFNEDGTVRVVSPDEMMKMRQAGLTGIPGAVPALRTGEPQDVFGAAARMAGATAAVGPIAGMASSFVNLPAAATTRLGRLAQFPQKMIAKGGESFLAHPLKTTIFESGFGAGAGAGGYAAQQIFPDSLGAEVVGEVLGGVLPAFTPIRLAIRVGGGVRNIYGKVTGPFREPGGASRAGERFARAVTPEQQARAEQGLLLPTTIDPETGLPVLTPAQRASEPGLLSLERSVMDSSEQLTRRADEQISHANAVIQQSITNIGGGRVATFEQTREYMRGLLDVRLRVATQHADERIAALGPRLSREEANRIVREELDTALEAARTQERDLYDAIPQNAGAPFTDLKARYESFKVQLSQAQQSDIPGIAKKFLEKGSGDYLGRTEDPSKFVTITTIKELRGLQGKLRENARQAKAAGKYNRERIANELANSINEDIAHTQAGPEVADKVSTAVSFSRDLHDRFSRGAVGKLLQFGQLGERVPAGLTLESSLGLSGPKAREGMDSILKAFESPEAPANVFVVDAAQDYMRGQFLRTAVQQGRLSTRAAQRFMRDNSELLDRMPIVKRQIQEAIDSGETMALTMREVDPKLSKAAMLVERGPVETFRQISGMQPQAAGQEVQKMLDMVAADSSGEALSGLKAGFMEYALSQARGRLRDIRGLPFISGYALRDALSTPGARAAATKVFSTDELDRLNIIVRDLIRMERRISAKAAEEGVIGDTPSKVLESIARVAGAAVGRHTAYKLGSGGTVQIPGIFSNRFAEIAKAGVKDPASKLIMDAIENESLFRDLLMQPITERGTGITPMTRTRLNAWTYAVLAEHGAEKVKEGR